MRNSEEHKKLLEQITALERESVNYFDVEREFFLIDSDNLSDVQPRFYGYSIQADGIYEEDNLTPEVVKNLDGRGCYVYVDVRDGQITIKQDLNGCWGIYLFRHGDYFALSNSFFRLVDHVKFRYPLTINRDYCNYLITSIVAVQSNIQTAVNEIRELERNAIIHIDVSMKELQIDLIDYKEHTVPLDSEEGIAILDRWVEFWSNVLRGIAGHTKFIQADLSGGFDSRMSFVPVLHSGLDLNNIRVYSVKSNQFVFPEDYAIASKIADLYGFKLNLPLPERRFLNYSLSDIWNLDLYHQQTIRNLPTMFFTKKAADKLYHVKGLSAEVMRKTWHMLPEKFISNECSPANNYSSNLSQELTNSIQAIIKFVYQSVCDKYKIDDPNSVEIPQYLYHETRTRTHCGKEIVDLYFKNTVTIAPAIDPEIQTLQLKSSKCPDYNFLMVLLLTRYAPDLLKVPFDKYHEPVALETIAPYAQKINERFPRRPITDKIDIGGGYFHLQPRDARVEKIISSGRNNPGIPGGLPEACLKATFESTKTFGLFTTHFDEELYRYAASYFDNNIFGRYRPLYAVTGVSRVLEDVEISQRNHPKYQDMKRFLEQDFYQIHDDAQIIRKFRIYFTARIQFQLWQKTTEGAIQILSISDNNAKISSPEWYQKNGTGYVIQSYVGNLKIVAKAAVGGQIRLELLGLDIRDKNDKTKRVPYWIDYTALTVNGKVVFDELTPAWHNRPYRHNIDAKAGKEITIEVDWLPHRSDT